MRRMLAGTAGDCLGRKRDLSFRPFVIDAQARAAGGAAACAARLAHGDDRRGRRSGRSGRRGVRPPVRRGDGSAHAALRKVGPPGPDPAAGGLRRRGRPDAALRPRVGGQRHSAGHRRRRAALARAMGRPAGHSAYSGVEGGDHRRHPRLRRLHRPRGADGAGGRRDHADPDAGAEGRAGRRAIIIAGGAAGVAAAFNTPIAGVVFALEELAKGFDRRTHTTAILVVVIAGFASYAVQGNYAYFGVQNAESSLLSALVAAPVIGIVCGAAGRALRATAGDDHRAGLPPRGPLAAGPADRLRLGLRLCRGCGGLAERGPHLRGGLRRGQVPAPGSSGARDGAGLGQVRRQPGGLGVGHPRRDLRALAGDRAPGSARPSPTPACRSAAATRWCSA